jgi:hypothetical protein
LIRGIDAATVVRETVPEVCAMHDELNLPTIDTRRLGAMSRIEEALHADGAAVFAGIPDRPGFLRLARALITIASHRDSDPAGVTAIVRRSEIAEQSGFAGFGDRELHPHTEGSVMAEPPRVLVLMCVRPASVGGHSVLVDGKQVYDDVAGEDSTMLTALSTKGSARFGGTPGFLGSVFEPAPNDRIRIRLRLDDLVCFSPTASRFVDRLRSVVDCRTRIRRLAAGEGFVVLNDRWLHGRTRFDGERTMLRVIGDPRAVLAVPAGFARTAAR